MGLPNVPYAATTAPQMVFLDQTFAALALCTVIPCSATGTNVIALTPVTNAPAVTTYTDKQQFGFVAANSSTGNVTAAVAGLATLTVFKADAVTQATTGDIVAGRYYELVYLSSLNALVITTASVIVATKTQMQTGTNNAATVTPARALDSDGAVKASANIAGAGTINGTSFNVSGVVRNSAGDYTISFTTPFVDANYVVTGAGYGNTLVVTITTQLAGSCNVVVRQTGTGTPTDAQFTIAFFGRQ